MEKTIVVDSGKRLYSCKNVYEPAEDTWLALGRLGNACSNAGGPGLCIDVGTGTGVLGLECTGKCRVYSILADLNPCAVYCALMNARRLGFDALTDIVQCDSLSCIRCGRTSSSILIVYNTPYLPVNDYSDLGLEALSWSGGLHEAARAARYAVDCVLKGCILLVYSSLSGDDSSIVRQLIDAGFRVEKIIEHYFFEDIMVVMACRT